MPLDVKVSDEMVAKGAEAVSAEVAAAMKQARDLAVPGLAPLESEMPGLDFCPQAHAKSGAYMQQRMAELYKELGIAEPPKQ